MDQNDKAQLGGQDTVGDRLLSKGAKMLPPANRQTTCPPGRLVSCNAPLIIVPSLMRSGTHLLLDSMMNNFLALRHKPLFIDFDAYERAGLPPGPIAQINGAIIKTHYPQTPLAAPYLEALKQLIPRAFIITPQRPEAEVRRSLGKWGLFPTDKEFADVTRRMDAFWVPFTPVTVEFSSLLKREGVAELVRIVAARTRLQPLPPEKMVMPSPSRSGVYLDKMMTRLFGRHAPRINTTMGYRLRPRQRP
jgi:hypothetical protein